MDKELLHTKVTRRMISFINSGVYKKGHKLPAERKLCEDFGISRGTLRKAMSDLEKMELITIKPQSGTYVSKFLKKSDSQAFSGTSLANIVVARKAIELSAIELACDRVSKAQINKLQKLLNEMEEAIDDLPNYVKLDMDFHKLIVSFSDNSALIAAFEAISVYHRYSHVFSSAAGTQGTRQSHPYHKRIFENLKKCDKQCCAKVLGGHLDNILKS